MAVSNDAARFGQPRRERDSLDAGASQRINEGQAAIYFTLLRLIYGSGYPPRLRDYEIFFITLSVVIVLAAGRL